MLLPGGVTLAEARRFSGLDRVVIRQHHAEAAGMRERYAIGYAVVGIGHGLGDVPATWTTDGLVAYGEWVCAHLEATNEPEGVLRAVLEYAHPVIVPARPKLEAVEAAGKSDAPTAGG